MSYQMIHDAVTEAVDALKKPDFKEGDKVIYTIISYQGFKTRKTREIIHEAVVDEVNEKTIKIMFKTGQMKYVKRSSLKVIE